MRTRCGGAVRVVRHADWLQHTDSERSSASSCPARGAARPHGRGSVTSVGAARPAERCACTALRLLRPAVLPFCSAQRKGKCFHKAVSPLSATKRHFFGAELPAPEACAGEKPAAPKPVYPGRRLPAPEARHWEANRPGNPATPEPSHGVSELRQRRSSDTHRYQAPAPRASGNLAPGNPATQKPATQPPGTPARF